jgi:hypothetical protein
MDCSTESELVAAACGCWTLGLISRDMRSHEWIDDRSLALDRAIADKLRAKPALVDQARRTLDRWVEQRRPAVPSVLLEWQEILAHWPLPRILDLLASDEENPRRLRQSSPFCGILSDEERLAILREYESRRA